MAKPEMSKAGRSPQLTADSIWAYKPWWCQPWSILLTGLFIISGSWYVFQRWWLTGIISAPVLVWMGFFIVIYPRLMKDMMLQKHEVE
ncbi:MAG: DUF6737 family protein [Cyanobacteria bacterium J06627_8]